MKILFLQNMDDSMGGIVRVNCMLMEKMLEDGHSVSLISIRHSGYACDIKYPQLEDNIVINDRENWGCPRYSEVIDLIKNNRYKSAAQMIKNRFKYDHGIKKDYESCRERIFSLSPDIIINSHYELLDAIPKEFLSKTINHFHTSFDQVISNWSYKKIFSKYKESIGKFVWLTEATAQQAIKAGLKNSTFIYNPISFSTVNRTDYLQKRMVFIGRISPEKRLDRAIKIFNEILEEGIGKDWYFDIYGTGNLPDELKEEIRNNSNIIFHGPTDDVESVMLKHSICLLTSDFEGMALVILEANECGVPVICFDFGESVYEEVLDKKTGYIIERENVDEYKIKLKDLMLRVEKRRNMGMEAKEFAKKFSIPVIIKKWYDIFDELNL